MTAWKQPAPVTSEHPLECLVVVPALRQSDGEWWMPGNHWLLADDPVAWMADTPENRTALREGSSPAGRASAGPSAEGIEPGSEGTRPEKSEREAPSVQVPGIGGRALAQHLQETRFAMGSALPAAQQPAVEPVAWLVHGGRMFADDSYLLEKHARKAVERRKDGSQATPLYASPTAQPGEKP